MLDIIKGFTEQVTEYSTIFGQIWYLCVFLFRGMVVVTIGGEVYSDEQSEFQCSTSEVGCSNVCFAKFSKISHIRFWAFQLLAVSTPTILFHFFVISVKARIEKRKVCVPQITNNEDVWSTEVESARDDKLVRRKPSKKKELRVRFKTVYDASSHTMKDVEVTDSITGAYYINVIFRAVIEGVFLYLSYILFKFMNHSDPTEDNGILDFIWFSVPMLFRCEGSDISAACHQHTSFGPGGYVPCWVSRPWEKTIFLRYMNVLGCLCFVLSFLEFIYLTLRGTRTANRRRKRRRSKNNDFFYSPNELSKIAIPISMNAIKRYQNGDAYVEVEDDDFDEERKKMEV